MKVVRGAGKRFKAEHLDVRATVSMLPYCRVAVVVGKHGHEIVERNRLRRRLRELVRTLLLPECRSIDVVVHARASAYAADFTALASEMESVREKLQLTFGET